MPYWILTFFLGISALFFCRRLPSLYCLLTIIPFVALSLLVPIKFKKVFLYILIAILGFFWAVVYAHIIMSWSLSPALENKSILITGHVTAPPLKKKHYLSFDLKTITINQQKQITKLKLSWYGKYPEINVGDKWQLLVRLKRPHGALNPGGFDSEKHLLMHHIRATGYVIDAKTQYDQEGQLNQILESSPYRYPLARLRQFLIDKMERALVFEPLTPVIIAFVTGAEDKITDRQWQVMRATGTSYLVAISGLHVGLVASLVLILVQFLWKLSSCLPLLLPAREAGVIAGLVVGFGYGAISGFSVPTQRALVMLVMFSMMVLSRRNSLSWNAWLWSLFLVLIINPLAVATIGFWLSFAAVAAIIYVSSNSVTLKKTHLANFWRMQLTVTIALLPLTLLFFQQFSLVTMVANLIAMPGVCLVIVPLSLLGALFCLVIPGYFGGWILWIGAKLLSIVWWWLTLLESFPHCSWYQPIYNGWILMAGSFGALLLLSPRGFPVRFLGLVWLLPLFFWKPPTPETNKFWLTVLDVGQGLAVVVQTKNHVLLYDTGFKLFDHDSGGSVIVPYLRQQGIKALDTMLVSHGDMDHRGGAETILKTFQVANILSSVPEIFKPRLAYSCVANQYWRWDGVDFYMLSPANNYSFSGNNSSCVLKVTNGKNSVLLPGDIEHISEKELIKKYGENLKSTVLIAPHHGSATSSSRDLINTIAPKYVIFSTGYKNRFRFPHKKIIERYRENNTILLNTPQTGAITFKFEDKSDILTYSLYRKIKQRFWHELK